MKRKRLKKIYKKKYDSKMRRLVNRLAKQIELSEDNLFIEKCKLISAGTDIILY